MKNSPYGKDYDELPESTAVSDPVALLKLELGAKFCKITEKLDNQDVIEATGLHKSDLSRLRGGSIDRFSLDRLVSLLDSLGYKAQVKVVRDGKRAS